MSDPAVKQAIRVLRVKGVTLKQIEAVYRYYESLARKTDKDYQEYVDSCERCGFIPNSKEKWRKTV